MGEEEGRGEKWQEMVSWAGNVSMAHMRVPAQRLNKFIVISGKPFVSLKDSFLSLSHLLGAGVVRGP